MSLQNLECYLIDLVQCFEGFVRATLLLLLLGLTAVFGMLYSIMNKLTLAEQRRIASEAASSSTMAHGRMAGSAGEETTTSGESEEGDNGKAKTNRLKKGKNNRKRGEKGTNEEHSKMKRGDQKEHSKTKRGDQKTSEEHSKKANTDENGVKAEDSTICDNPCAKNSPTSSNIDVEEVPCALTNPPCEGVVVCPNKRTKRPSVKVCRDGRGTRRLLSPRPSLVCTPSNCSLTRNAKNSNCMSHLPGCTSNGLYTKPVQKSRKSGPRIQENMSLYNHFSNFVKIMPSLVFNGFGFNYVAIFTIVSIVILSYLLPDISQKLLLKKEVKNVEKVLDLMTKEVNRAETACITVAEELCMHCAVVRDNATETVSVSIAQEGCSHALVSFLQSSKSEPMMHNKRPAPLNQRCLGNRKTSFQEIALMSFVYTDSFDDARKALL